MTDTLLPLDVLHLIAGELAEQQDFATLYSCAISGSDFARAGAIQGLYKKCNSSPVVGGGSETSSAEGPMAEQISLIQRWSILWRSIILSSLGKTMYPYCQFLRVLDLRDLLDLLDEDRFRGKILSYFFSGDLAHLNMTIEGPRIKGVRRMRLDTKSIILSVADAITKQAVKLEVLTDPVAPGLDLLSAGLSQWSPRLRYLQFLQLGDGKVLGDYDVQDLLIASCPQLTKLEIYRWMNDDASDIALARLFRKLPPNTLTSFQNESDCGIGPETCAALSAHASSLESLTLAVGNKAIPGLGVLKPCSSLVSLALQDFNAPHVLEATENDVLESMIQWLCACTKLKTLALGNFPSAPNILTPAMEQEKFLLDTLEISGSFAGSGVLYKLSTDIPFHAALSKQTALQTLLLAAETEGSTPAHSAALCSAICCMKSLKKLNLSRASDQFGDNNVVAMCEVLPELEELYIDPYWATDECLAQLNNMKQLKSITFAGLSTFSYAGLAAFVDKLGPGNAGLAIDIVNPWWDTSISEREQASISRSLKKMADGTFVYQVRDPNDAFNGSDSDSD